RDLIGDQNRAEARALEHLRLAELCGGDSDRAGGELPARHLGGLWSLEMRSELLRPVAKECRHRRDVLLDRIEVEEQSGSIDVSLSHGVPVDSLQFLPEQ